MDKKLVFEYLKTQEFAVLLGLLDSAYDEMDTNQRRSVFGKLVHQMPPPVVDGEELLVDIEGFHSESLAGVYYAPFDINSKNYMDIPEETEEWFELLGDFLEKSRLLSQQGNHPYAIQCFGLLYDLIDVMDQGDTIVFAHELGSWMIPGDEKPCIQAYITSLAVCSTPEEFATATIPLLRRDSYESFANKVYATVIKAASKEQRVHLDEEIARQNIRTTPKRKR